MIQRNVRIRDPRLMYEAVKIKFVLEFITLYTRLKCYTT
jgi:hypothetical protein